MSGSRQESDNDPPEFDPQTIAEIDGSIGEWLASNHATTPEEAQVNEFKSYFDALKEMPLSISEVSKYEICYENGANIAMWPRATTPIGKLYDLVLIDDNENIAIQPFVVVGSLVCQESLDGISDELRAHMATQCAAYARGGIDIPVQVDANGLMVLLAPTLCDDSYLVMMPAYTSITDRVAELPISDVHGYSDAQPMWRVGAINTSGVVEHYLIEAGAMFSYYRVVSAQAHLTDGTVEDIHTYMSGTEE